MAAARGVRRRELFRTAAGDVIGAYGTEDLPAEDPAVAVDRVGGPVSAWHHDRVAACIAQARGRYAEAAVIARRGFERMRVVEPAPATGAYFALLIAMAGHIGTPDATIGQSFDPPPRFATMAHLTRAYLQSCTGRNQEAAASYRQAGPIETWSLPAFFVMPGYVYAALACAGIGRYDDLAVLLERLEPFRGEHAVGNGVAYLGPVELALGRGAAALGRLDDAIVDLTTAVHQASRAGAPGFVAEAQYHLVVLLLRVLHDLQLAVGAVCLVGGGWRCQSEQHRCGHHGREEDLD